MGAFASFVRAHAFELLLYLILAVLFALVMTAAPLIRPDSPEHETGGSGAGSKIE